MSENRFRMDFIQELISLDERTGVGKFVLKPDPRRYEWKMVEGKKMLYDKFDNVYIAEEAFKDAIKGLAGRPMYFEQQELGNTDEYIKLRKEVIRKTFNQSECKYTFVDKSEDFLNSLSRDKLGFVIISVDISGSTMLSTKLDGRKFSKVISLILYELSEIVPKFRGYVLKYTGDGLIAYFPEPSFITKNDLAIDCAISLRKVLYEMINPFLKELSLPEIGMRIGIESGDAYIETIGSPTTKQHKDIIGLLINLACKIQGRAELGGILLGECTERNLHTSWRSGCEEVKLDGWDYKKSDGSLYKVYKFK